MNYNKLLRGCITLFSFLLFPLLPASADFVGVVYLDLNKNKKKMLVSKDGIRYCNGTAVLVEDTMLFAAERALISMDPANRCFIA